MASLVCPRGCVWKKEPTVSATTFMKGGQKGNRQTPSVYMQRLIRGGRFWHDQRRHDAALAGWQAFTCFWLIKSLEVGNLVSRYRPMIFRENLRWNKKKPKHPKSLLRNSEVHLKFTSRSLHVHLSPFLSSFPVWINVQTKHKQTHVMLHSFAGSPENWWQHSGKKPRVSLDVQKQ